MVDFIYSQSQSKLFDIPIYKYILHNTYIVTAVHSFLSLFQKKKWHRAEKHTKSDTKC